jgi:hypothetical protein
VNLRDGPAAWFVGKKGYQTVRNRGAALAGSRILVMRVSCGEPDGRDDELRDDKIEVVPVQAGNGVAEVYKGRR